MKKPLYFLLLLIAFKLLWGIGWTLFGPIALSPDEAQYWLWGNFLDWGYYSKPPAIAWQIATSTWLFGNSEFGVRAWAILINAALVPVFYYFSRSVLNEKQSSIATLLFTFSPMSLLGSFFATTDAGMLFFWILGSAFIAQRFNHVKRASWQFGLCILLGALFKWTCLILLIALIPLCWTRRYSYKEALVALGIASLTFLPSLFWNMEHNWVTFRHVWTQSTGSSAHGNPVEFLLGQIGLIGPIVFACLFSKSLWKQPTYRFFQCAFLGSLLLYFALSFFHKMQLNWMLWGVVWAFLIAAPLLATRKVLTITHCLLSLFASAWLLSPLAPWHIFPHTQGNREISLLIKKSDYRNDTHFLCSDTYQGCSLASFYGPDQERAYFINIGLLRQNQFSFWPSLENEIRQEGRFFAIQSTKEPHTAVVKYEEALQDVFASSALIDLQEIAKDRWAFIFECSGLIELPNRHTNKY